jgi:diaminopimelate decarboxylase
MSATLTNHQLIQIAAAYGTPTYVYHAEKITQQYTQLQNAFAGSNAKFFYACKALTNINILRHIKSIGCNIDCSSINEAKLALHVGFSPQNILYTSNNIAFEELEEAASLGININIDSLSNVEKFGKKFGSTYPIGVRLRPNIMAGGNLKIATGHANSKFGIPIEHLAQLHQIVQSTNLQVHALHIHTGSEIKDVSIFMQGLEVLFAIAPQFANLKIIDLGGGFKVPYASNEEGTDIKLLGQEITNRFAAIQKQLGKQLQVWFEPGKYLVAEAGYLVTQVTVLKQNIGHVFVGVDTGLNHLIRPMMYGAYHQIENCSNPNGTINTYNVAGNICETDNFATDRPLPEVREADFLVIKNAGAYGFEMASNYNARYKPAEVLVKNNLPTLIRKRETFTDLLQNQIDTAS